MLAALDYALAAIHVAFILSFLLLWIPRSTSRVHGYVVLVTALSWFGVGLFKGFGYCVLTDLEWHVKRARGIRHIPGSFLKYAGDFITGKDLSPAVVNTVAATTFLFGCAVALFRLWQRGRERSSSGA